MTYPTARFTKQPTGYFPRLAMGIAFAALVCSVVAAQSGTSNSVIISGRVVGATGSCPVFVALWSESGFLQHPSRQIRIAPGTPLAFQFQVPPGRWALSAFEDSNGNGVLDMGVFGPKEPSGFSRPFHAWRKPHFDDVAVRFDRNRADVEIKLER
jgi:uncharacterized protein (DUF2141 family)